MRWPFQIPNANSYSHNTQKSRLHGTSNIIILSILRHLIPSNRTLVSPSPLILQQCTQNTKLQTLVAILSIYIAHARLFPPFPNISFHVTNEFKLNWHPPSLASAIWRVRSRVGLRPTRCVCNSPIKIK